MINLRPLTENDLEFLLEVRNDNSTLQFLENDSKFTLKQSIKWFRETQPKWFIIEINRMSVGYIRTNGDEVGCDIHPNFRRRGYAKMAYELYLKDKSYASLWVFKDNFAPAEFSFSTYVRPVKNLTANNGRPGDWEAADVGNDATHAVEEVLWALFTGDSTFTKSAGSTASDWTGSITNNTTNMVVDFSASNKSQLGKANLYFVMGGDQSIVSTTNTSQSAAAQKVVAVAETLGIKKG